MQTKKVFLIVILVLFAFSISLSGCSSLSGNDYDKGYSDGFSVKEKGIFYSLRSEEYKNGYEDGLYNANIPTVFENLNKDIEATANYLGMSINELKESLKELGYSFE